MLAVLTVNSLLDTTVAGRCRSSLLCAKRSSPQTRIRSPTSGSWLRMPTRSHVSARSDRHDFTLLGGTEIQITDAVTINGPGAANPLRSIGSGAITHFQYLRATSSMPRSNVSHDAHRRKCGCRKLSGGARFFPTAFGLLTISDSVLTGNTADFGGAIYAAGDLAVTNTTIGGIGALKNVATTAAGGGIFAYGSATTTIKNSTISGNTAGSVGGGVYSGGHRSGIWRTARSAAIGGRVMPETQTPVPMAAASTPKRSAFSTAR